MKKTVITLADGRELFYYDSGDGEARGQYPDLRPLEPMHRAAETRYDEVQGEWIAIAAHRQNRTYKPPADQCPLCPSEGDRLTEIPAPDYEVAVFENRFPSLGRPGRRALRGRLLHVGARQVLRPAQRGAGGAGARGVDRPDRGPAGPSRRAPGLHVREPRRGDRRHPRAPARPDLRLPVPRAENGPRDTPRPRRTASAPAGTCSRTWSSGSPPPSGSSTRTSTGSPSRRTPRAGRTRRIFSRSAALRTSPRWTTRSAPRSPRSISACCDVSTACSRRRRGSRRTARRTSRPGTRRRSARRAHRPKSRCTARFSRSAGLPGS